MKIAFLLSVLLPSLASAQVDTLRENLQYYPLQAGDYWEYLSVAANAEPPFEKDSSAYSIQVIGDTLLANGLRYQMLQYVNIYPVHDSSYLYERIDSLSGSVFRYDTTWPNDERKVDSLFAQPGDAFLATPNIPSSFSSIYFESGCQRTALDTILGIPTQTKDFGIGSIEENSYTLAKGFGLTSIIVAWDFGRTDITLRYARIDRKEYGTEIPDEVTTTPIHPRAFTLFQNYPNPFNPSTTIRFELQMRSIVTLKVYDILGRQLAILANRTESAGVHSVTFIGNGLPSGAYFYRLDAGTYHDTKKFILVK